MMEWVIGIIVLTPWLSLLALWWCFILGAAELPPTIGGSILFFLAVNYSVYLVDSLLQRLHKRSV